MLFINLFLILTLTICFALHLYQKRRRDAVANIPGPFCVPLLGCIQHFMDFDPKSETIYTNLVYVNLLYINSIIIYFKDIFVLLKKFGKIYGKIARGWAFNRLLVFSIDTELNEQILSSQQHIVKHRHYMILKPWLGTGLLMSDGKKWFARRKVITPTFHFKILDEFVKIFEQHANTFVRQLEQNANGSQSFDVFPFVCLATLDIIAGKLKFKYTKNKIFKI